MDKLVLLGRIAGTAGIVLSAVAVVVRLTGSFYFAGVPVATLLQGGIAGMAAGCFLLLVARR